MMPQTGIVHMRPYRIHIDNNSISGEVATRGGVTVAYRKAVGNEYHVTVARCRPDENYSKKDGRWLAVYRLSEPNVFFTIEIADTDNIYTVLRALICRHFPSNMAAQVTCNVV